MLFSPATVEFYFIDDLEPPRRLHLIKLLAVAELLSILKLGIFDGSDKVASLLAHSVGVIKA